MLLFLESLLLWTLLIFLLDVCAIGIQKPIKDLICTCLTLGFFGSSLYLNPSYFWFGSKIVITPWFICLYPNSEQLHSLTNVYRTQPKTTGGLPGRRYYLSSATLIPVVTHLNGKFSHFGSEFSLLHKRQWVKRKGFFWIGLGRTLFYDDGFRRHLKNEFYRPQFNLLYSLGLFDHGFPFPLSRVYSSLQQ